VEQSRHPSDVDKGMEGHAGRQRAERHEMEAVIDEEEETEEAIEQADEEEDSS